MEAEAPIAGVRPGRGIVRIQDRAGGGRRSRRPPPPIGARLISIRLRILVIASVVLVMATACTLRGTQSAFSSAQSYTRAPASSKIKHIVIVVQEGRTLNNLFAGWPGAYAPMSGEAVDIPGPIRLREIKFGDDRSMSELSPSMTLAYWGARMDGFDLNRFCVLGCAHFPNGHKPDTSLFPYAYMNRDEIAPYRTLAGQYVLADNMYSTEWGGDFTAHQYLIAGTTFISPTRALRDVPNVQPWGCDAARRTRVSLWGYPYRGVFPCVTQYPTMADLLDNAGLDWKYYVASLTSGDPSGKLWNAFEAVKNVRDGPDWTRNIVSPPSEILLDAAKGKLPSVSWVIPKVAWSDHPSQKSDKGPSWVASVVNAVGEGPEWDDTAIIIVWSEWGGWFDARPPYFPKRLKGTGLAFRVPLLIVSPYARKDVVVHTDYQFGSILRFVEEALNLPPLSSLGYGFIFTDSTSNSLNDSFNFSQEPRKFEPIPAKYSPSHFMYH
jgi:phospholipase C